MWSLSNKADTVYYLPSGGSYTIGRKSTDIIILEDQSISRLHALITVKDNNVVLKDEKSKFGTEVNGCKLSSEQVLSNGDIIKFGQGTTSFKLKKQELVFCYSNMTSNVKEQVSAIVEKLGSKIVSNWSSSCTHLVMTAVTITAKVVNALSSCCPIVSVAWLEESLKCLDQKKVLPSSDNYVPEVVDPNLLQSQHANVSLKPMLMRRRLFSEKNIYFLIKKQYLMLQYCLKAAGGKPHLITDVTDERIKLLADDNALVIDPLVSGPLFSKVKNTLKLSNLRLISESEIGYGILHCSISHYCNAKSLEGCSQIPPQLPPSLSIPYTQPSVGNDTILALNSEALNSQTSTREIQGSTREGTVLEIDETILRDQTPSNATLMSHSIQVSGRKVARSSNETILAPDSLTLTQNISSQKRQRLDSGECSFSKKTKLSQSESENFLATPHSIPNVPLTSTFLSSRNASPQKISLPDFEVSDAVASPRTQFKKNVEPSSGADSSMFAGLLTQRRKVECATSKDTMPSSNHWDTHSDQEMKHTEALQKLQSSMNISCDGFISARQPHTQVPKREEIPEEERLPTEVIIETVGLVRKLIPSSNSVNTHVRCIRNFKTFKKVTHPRNHSSVSRLIGGADLFISSLQRAL
ncbi:PREDICTED: nibrin-like isoform X2 [Amphimedon queenslandica]|uniref:Nibrin n=1 Tax=Amphimedon queenslandica TaxID=400682 RepID=A0A1X7V1L9_AMPQE|nr:PREDICTED: nibrin-like isoform X2 [Amphimedon queenslandica]|eukprot:XP_019851017.1 PREDICTED: nibrin-like isoform X2 [Amphimedon queenslandica]